MFDLITDQISQNGHTKEACMEKIFTNTSHIPKSVKRSVYNCFDTKISLRHRQLLRTSF